jgi:hypothetical protein
VLLAAKDLKGPKGFKAQQVLRVLRVLRVLLLFGRPHKLLQPKLQALHLSLSLMLDTFTTAPTALT